MNLRDDLYPTYVDLRLPNDVISNDTNNVWIVPINKFTEFVEYIKHKYPNLNYRYIEYLINADKRKDILLALSKDSDKIRYCVAHPNECIYKRMDKFYICSECIKLRGCK